MATFRKKISLFLIDFEGNVIRLSQHQSQASQFIINPSLKSILNGDISECIDLIKQAPNPGRLAVAVKNNSFRGL